MELYSSSIVFKKSTRSSEKLLATEDEIWLECSQRIRARQAFLFNFKLLYSTENQVQCISFYHVILIRFLSFSLLYSKPYTVRVQPEYTRFFSIVTKSPNTVESHFFISLVDCGSLCIYEESKDADHFQNVRKLQKWQWFTNFCGSR